jgi:hypothetical protein
LEIEYIINYQGSHKVYKEVITPERYQTYLDDHLHAFNTSGRGEDVAEWDNEYGFVPCVHTMHMDVGMKFGANSWYTVMHKINEINDLASILNDGARKQVQMPLFSVNSKISGDLGSDQSSSTTNRDDVPRKDTIGIINLSGTDVDIKALPPTIDLTGGLELIREVLQEIERDLPELSLHRIREGGNLTAPGVRAAYSDAVSKIQEAQGNYYGGLIEAQKMAVAINGMRGRDGYQGFNLTSYERGDLEHYIDPTPVISDTLSKSEMITLTLQAMSQSAPAPVYGKIGWDETDVDDILEAQEAQSNAFMMNAQFKNNSDPQPPDDTEATPEDAFDVRQNGAVNATDINNARRLLPA